MLLSYRIATQNDLVRIVEIYNSTVASRMVTADTEPVSVESRQKWFDEHIPTKRPLWVIEDVDKNQLAWLSFQSFYGRPAYDGTAEVSIYIDEGYRGKGLGKQILAFAMEQAPFFNIKNILCFVFDHNLPSMKLFDYFGFERWGFLPQVAILDEQEVNLVILGRKI